MIQGESLGTLVHQLHMLSSMAVAYGNADDAAMFIAGNQSEVVLNEDGFQAFKVPLSENTLYDLASLTKLFTLVALLMLLEARQLKMTDTIGCIDERFSLLQDTTIYDVVTYQALLKTPARIDRQSSRREAEGQLFQTFQSKAYQDRIYSDMNALVLQYVIEKVSGLSLIEFLKENVFAPLHMENTWGKVPEHALSRCSSYNFEHTIVNGRFHVNSDIMPGTPHDPKARILMHETENICGHAGLFSTLQDMVRFAQGLLHGKLVSPQTLALIGKNKTGHLKLDGTYRQYMGLLCFSKSILPRRSEVPLWMGKRAFALSGYTGNHIAFDPDLGVFDLLLGNRCHNRVSLIYPSEEESQYPLHDNGSGMIHWPDGREVYSSHKYVYLKDQLLHNPIYELLVSKGWVNREDKQ